MAGEDLSIKTKVEADVSNFEKGMNKAEKALKDFSNKLADNINRLGKKGLVGSIANVTLAMQGLTKSFGTVVKFAKDVGKAVNECTEAYKGQVIAERALNTAIANNPFISGESSKALLQFASDMQKVTNYGDDELIPMMTNLVSLGRSESEVMQIMSVAMDMSAGMGISLDTAITQLNATLNGNIGRLGQQNAELKDLTEVELRSGKAIEILGEKFKGLSSATADTSKQLQNMKGDFKEALGQFTLPSSDMWNKFWAGFYQKGIEAINKINAFMDSQIIGKKLANAITEQIARINPADIGGRVDYTRNVLRVIGDNELEALKNYLSGLKNLSAEQEIILKRIKAEEDSRYQSSINAKKEAEAKKEQADKEAQITAELQKQEELNKKKTDWASKILDQRIEMLETERDRAMQYAEEEGKESYTIWRDYNEKILELKLEALEREKEKELNAEGITAEDKVAIEEYYSGETKKIYQDLGNYKRKKKEEEKKEEINYLKVVFEETKKYLNKTTEAIKKFAEIAKKVVKAIFDTVSKLVKFSISDSLDKILEFEDAILTFFVETLPNLPKWMESVIQSVQQLFSALKSTIKADSISDIVFEMLSKLGDALPQLVEDLSVILEKLVGGAIDGLVRWLDNGGLKTLLDSIATLQKSVQNIVMQLLKSIADLLENHTGDLTNFLSETLTTAMDSLPELIDSLLRIVNALLKSIADLFKDKKFIDSFVNSVIGVFNTLMDHLPELIGTVVDLILSLITAIVPRLPEIIISVISKIVETIPKVINEIVGKIGAVISDIFSRIFTAEFWQDVFGKIGEGFQKTFESLGKGLEEAFTKGGYGKNSTGSTAGDLAVDLLVPFGFLRHFFADGTNSAPAGLALVGEQGPELINFRGGEQVINNRNTQKALAGTSGTTINQNVTFNNLQDTSAYAMMNQLKQYNRQMAINSVF